MNTKLYPLLLILLFSSCGNNNEQVESKGQAESNVTAVVYDTTVIDYTLENTKVEQYNAQFENLSIAAKIDSLKSFGSIQGILELNEQGLPFDDFKSIPKFYTHNIPQPIYKQIFADEVIQIDRVRNASAIVNEKERKVIIEKGPKITETRKYKHLLSVIEKANYLQLLITMQGKYAPEIELITLSKKELSPIDKLNLYGGIYDSYDINYWHSRFSEGHNELVLTKVENRKFDDIELDTTKVEYRITSQGEIVQLK